MEKKKNEQIKRKIMQDTNTPPPANSIVFSYPWFVYVFSLL